MTREEAIKLLMCEKVCVEDVDGNIGGERVRQAYDMAIEALSAERTGEWIDMSDGGRIKYIWYEKYMCNKCGERGTSAWLFCPNCGAKMGGKE